MNKKQILATALAGLMTINLLGGCSKSNRTSSSSNVDTSVEEVLDDNYRISIIMSSVSNENGTIVRKVPKDFILVDSLGYKVERLISSGYTYPADKTVREDGTVAYWAHNGGTLVGDIVELPPVYELVTGDEALEVVHNYLDENSLRLSK